MRASWRAEPFGYGTGARGVPAFSVTQGASVPAPIGGWDAINPLANMPEQNAVQLINWFPQPGWVEIRKGHLNHCDTGTGTSVDTVMAYMSQSTATDKLIAASGGKLFDVTSSTPSTLGTGYTSNRWQWTDFANTAGNSFLFMVNGSDAPQYYSAGSITVPTITCSDSASPSGFINVWSYHSRLWFVMKNSTKAYYLGVGAVAGTATVFDVGPMFLNGGYLIAIGSFSSETISGPNEFICFFSSQGDVAVYNISDPTTTSGIALLGRGEISQPVGYRCVTRWGADLAVITLDGLLPISQVLTYDKAQLIGKSITNNIRQAITTSMQTAKDNFGWEAVSYPRSTMLILNVPLTENSYQEQYVQNTITGAWGRFQGQYANSFVVFLDLLYFGDNAGIVHLADTSAGDQNQTLMADMQCAWNYFQNRAQLKRWNTIRPNISIDQTYPVSPQLGVNVDYGTTATLYPINFSGNTPIPLWDTAIWDTAIWTGDVNSVNWTDSDAYGWTASIRVTVSLPWDSSLTTPKTLRVNSFDYLIQPGGFV